MIVAWLRYDERTVDVYGPDGRFLCEAVRMEELTPAQVLDTKRAQRMRHAKQSKRMRASISRSEERYAPTKQPDGLDIITRTAREPAQAPRPADTGSLVEQLGLTEGLHEPWEPDR